MKKYVHVLLLCLFAVSAANTELSAQGTLIHYWHFNNYTTIYSYPQSFPIGPIDADFSIHDTSKARIYMTKFPGTSSTWHSTSATIMDPVATVAADADTVNLRMGQLGANGLRPRNQLDSAYLLFYIPTVNYQNIRLTYGSESSSVASGDTYQLFEYSVDSGVTWQTSGLSQTQDSAWLVFHRTSITFSDPLVNNNPGLAFRIHFVGHNNGTSGNNRFDNVTVDGDSIIAPVPIHYWNFNNYSAIYSYPQTFPIGRIDADFSAIDTSKARIYMTTFPGTSPTWHSTSATIMDPVATVAADADTVNLRFGAIGGNGLRPRNQLDSAYLLFYIPSTGYHDVIFSYGSESSSVASGDTYQIFDYSVDSGVTWRTALLSKPQDSAWLVFHRTSVTFTSDSQANNNPKLVFRIHFSGHTNGTSGNNRFDNVTLDGIPYPISTGITTTAASFGPFCNASANPVSVAYTSVGTFTGTWSVQLSNAGGTFPSNTTSNIIGTGTTSPITASIPIGTAAGNYRVRVINTNPALMSANDNGSNIVINGPPTAYTVTGGGGFCAGGAGVPVGLSNSQTGVKYQLYRNISTIVGGTVGGTGAAIPFGNQTTAGTYTVVATNTVTPTCTSNMTGSVSVTVNPIPTVITGTTTICSGNSVTLSDGVSGGTWSSNSTFVASVDPSLGTVTAYATGLAIITYTLPGVCYTTTNVIVNSAVPAITGTMNACPGTSSALSDASGSGTWTSSDNTLATVDIFGNVSGVAAGSLSISYIVSPGCITSAPFLVNPLPSAITGTTNVCVGLNTTLNDPDGTGTWSSSDPLTATVDVSTGSVGGVAAGSPTITYTLPTGCSLTTPFTVNPLPDPIGGATNVCAGLTTGLTDGGSGTWSSDNTAVATVNSSTGVVMGNLNGTANITYTLPTGCIMSTSFVVNPLPSAITGTATVCAGLSTTLNDPDSGGSWSTTSAHATVDPTSGAVTGISAGTPVITYTLPTTCMITAPVTVNPLPSAIGGATNVCVGLTTTLTDFGGGTWSNDDATVATINASTGLVNGIANGTTMVTYTLPTGCIASTSFVVNPLPTAITGTTVVCAGSTTTLGNGSTGGTWSSSNTTMASVGYNTGVVSGIAAGTPNITYTLGTGCRISAPLTVNALPTVYPLTGGGNYCFGGTGVHIGLAGSNAGVTYQINKDGSPFGGSITSPGGPLDFGTFTDAANYTVVALNTATTCTDNMSGFKIVGINPLPVQYTVTGGGNFCAGGMGVPVGLSGSSAGVTYQLLKSGSPIGLPKPGTTAAINFGLQTLGGSYTVVASNTATGCTNTMVGSASVVVNSLPAVHAMTGGGNYCAGSGGLHLGLNNSNVGISYQLLHGITLVGSPVWGDNSPLDFGSFTLDETYHVIATDSATGCSSDMSGTESITTNPLPDVHAITGGGSYCATGTGVHIGIDGSNIGITYQLYNGAFPVSVGVPGSIGPVDFGLVTGAGTYHVVASNVVTGCTNTMSGTTTVVVNPTVTPTISLSTGVGDTICSGRFVTLTTSVTNSGTIPAYSWSVNGVPTVSGNTYSYIPSDGDHVTVTMTSSAPCAAPPAVSSSLNLTVLSTGAPAISIASGSGNTVCQGNAVNFTFASTNEGSAPLFLWMVNGLFVSSGTSYSYTPVNHDVVSCLLISDYYCRIHDSATSNNVTMEVDAPLTPAVTITANPGFTVANGQSLTLNAAVTNGGPAPTYQWYINGLPVPGQVSSSFTSNTFFNGDSVTCRVLSSGGCSGIPGSKSVTVHVTVSGVKQLVSAGSDIRLVPNPNKGLFSLKGTLATTDDQEVSVIITNMVGQVVYRNTFSANGGKVDEQISLNSTLANGMYLLNMRSGDQNDVFHFVIEQ